MTHSLTLGRQIELFASGQYIDSGPAAGAVIRLGQLGGSSSGGFDLGAGEPQTTVITSMLLDGERPVGKRTGNAVVNLPIYVRAPGLNSLFAARETVLAVVDQETWELVLQLEDMNPTVFDCLRAKTTLPFTLHEIGQDVLTFNISCQRLPFGRSDQQESITIQAPPGTPGGGAVSFLPDIRVDGFETNLTTTILSGTSWSYNTSIKRYGTSGTRSYQTSGASVFKRTLAASVNLTSYTSLRFWTAAGGTKAVSRTYWIVFYDTGGHVWHLPSVTAALPGGTKFVASYMSLRTVPPPADFNIAAINQVQFKTTDGIYLDDLDAIDSTVNVIGGSRGGVYQIHDVKGSARTPINLDLNRPSASTITGGLVHHPKEIPENYLPLIQLNPATPIDGRAITLPNGGVNQWPWQGTYSVVLAVAALVGGANTSRTTSVTITQTLAGNTNSVTASRTYTPNEIGGADYLYLDRVTLPIRAIPPDNQGANWGVTINCTLGGGSYDSFTDLMFIDTEGQTLVWQNAAAAAHVYVDEPDPVVVNHGLVLAGASHQTAGSILDKVNVLSGEPMGFVAGENSLLVHIMDGAAQLTVNYAPRWHGIRVG